MVTDDLVKTETPLRDIAIDHILEDATEEWIAGKCEEALKLLNLAEGWQFLPEQFFQIGVKDV
jgi:hypothetical protein